MRLAWKYIQKRFKLCREFVGHGLGAEEGFRFMLQPAQPLYVYELKGEIPSLVLELEGLLGIWPEADYTYLFFTAPAEACLHSFLGAYPGFTLTRHYRLRYDQWQQLPGPGVLRVGRFKIVTDRRQERLAPGEILLCIDPGVIFGSGLHPTTRGCLRALSLLYSRSRPERVLDLGTGTGILAIAAAKLGASEVLAVDLNPLAISTAAANCRRNGVAEKVCLRQADARDCLPPADLICVNIHFDFLQGFFQGSDLCGYRWAVIGGFLKEKLQAILGLLPSCARVIHPALKDKGWMTLIVRIDP